MRDHYVNSTRSGTVFTMIAYLRGIARSSQVVDVDGVGYLVHCPVPLRSGEQVELHIHTQVRDDAITLYGFVDENDKRVFEALVRVTGVGPAVAMALLAGVGADAVVSAVTRKDAKALTAARGVGIKVAEKIVTLARIPDGIAASNETSAITDALVGLGFDRQTAGEAAKAAIEGGDNEDEAAILTTALSIAQRMKR